MEVDQIQKGKYSLNTTQRKKGGSLLSRVGKATIAGQDPLDKL